MNLGQFRELIKSAERGKMFEYGISDPFSWRGSYDQVAFAIKDCQMSREEILSKIDSARIETFTGWKGGEYRYCDTTPVNFEESVSDYSSGTYCREAIALIKGDEFEVSQEMELAKLAFK